MSAQKYFKCLIRRWRWLRPGPRCGS